jgi:hypothetical protein
MQEEGSQSTILVLDASPHRSNGEAKTQVATEQ